MTVHPNDELLQRFYAALDSRDGATMAACYTRDATFSDPVFGRLTGDEPGAMWRMLTSRSSDLTVELVEHAADDQRGTAHWVARYTFGSTGRPVVNDIRSLFTFRDGLIADQQDDFDFHRWARQALGGKGVVLGWTKGMQGAVRKQARAGLDAFRAR